MLRHRCYISALCQVVSPSRAAPIQLISKDLFPYYHIAKLINSFITTLFLEYSDYSLSNSLSIILGLSISRLNLKLSSLSELNLPLAGTHPWMSERQVTHLLQIFDKTWDYLRGKNLVFVMNSFLIKLLQMISPSSAIIDILLAIAPQLSFILYPRFILLLDWLVENNILAISCFDISSTVSVQQSPNMLRQILAYTKIWEPSIPPFQKSELVNLAQVRDI